MSVLTDNGRKYLLACITDNPGVFVAFGEGHPDWSQTRQSRTETFGTRGGVITLGLNNIFNVTVKNAGNPGVTYLEGTDFIADYERGRVHHVPAGGIGKSTSVLVEFDTETQGEDLNASQLENEVGRKRAETIGYIKPDPYGSIPFEGSLYSLSATPTRHVYLSVRLAPEELSSNTIRETGIFIGGTIKGSVPASKTLYLPADVDEQGTLFALDNQPPLIRNNITTEVFHRVISL